jgi:cytochrome c-type biogenesis protein CcmF
MFGKILIILTVLFGLLSTILYLVSYKKDHLRKLGRIFYYLMTAGIVGASIYLLANILGHNFQFTYIWEYSSTELQNYFLVASFYSGQQGSFMLWMIVLAIIGLFLINGTKNNGYESLAMGFFTSIIFYIALILIFKSPFDYVWETFSGEGLEAGFMPANGRGLNPILQNYWITIHPPILFIGYSMMAVPFVLALAALIKKEYKTWIDILMPWALTGTAILGLGIMLGGFWAYETLGWGGFWAWDPVENSSLIPWMIAVALIHTLMVQRRTGGLIKTNLILGMLSFIFVVYATFLTRSGVLGDTSVHSFVTPGAIVYTMLIFFQITYLGLGIFYIAYRFKDINKYLSKTTIKDFSKEYSLTLGSILILAMAAIVIMGTSWPAVAELFGQQKVAIEISVYDKFGTVFAIVFLLINGFSLYQKWMIGNLKDVFGKIILPFIASALLVVLLAFMGLDSFNFILLTFAAVFSLLTNLEFLIRNLAKNPKKLGPYLSHFGVAFLILGVVASGGYEATQQVRLTENQTKSAFGYDFTFIGKKRIEQEFKDREKYRYNVSIKKGNEEKVVGPIIYWSDFNEWKSPFLEPGVFVKVEKDIYLAPKAVEAAHTSPEAYLRKAESTLVPIDSSLRISITGFDFDQVSGVRGNTAVIGTILKTQFADESSRADTLYSMLDVTTWESQPNWYQIPDTEVEISMIRLVRDMNDVQNTKAHLVFKKAGMPEPEPMEIFTFDVTIKPFINLVWLGTILIVVGFLLPISKYTAKGRKNNITQE